MQNATHVVKKTLISDLTFRMPQHTSSEVTIEYSTIRFKCLREKLEPNYDTSEEKN